MRIRIRQTLLWSLALTCLIVLAGPWSPASATDSQPFDIFLPRLQSQNEPAISESYRELAEIIAERGNVPVLLHLAISEWEVGAAAQASTSAIDEAAIVDAQQGVLGALAGFRVENIKTFQYTPLLAVTLWDVAALEALAADELVVKIEEDRLESPLLAESVPLIGATYTRPFALSGLGQSIAILDTGVDSQHPALQGKVVAYGCFSTNNAEQGLGSLCPNNVTESTQIYSGVACGPFISGCDHGTHVAGIASAVAPSAQIIAIQVFSRADDSGENTPCADSQRPSPCTRGFVSDQIKALEYVRTLHTAPNGINVASVNMSLGGGSFTSECTTDARRIMIRDLRVNHGIIVAVSTGNSGFTNAISAPACVPEAFSVAASDKNDAVAGYSNISNVTDVIAPGTNIYAPVHSPNFAAHNGTSMAAPHVAGAAAVLRASVRLANAGQIETALRNSGVSLTDTRAGVAGITKRRVDVWHAYCLLTTCDADDLRTVVLNSAVNGRIEPADDRDFYYLQGIAGQSVTLRLNQVTGTLNPNLLLYDPDGVRVAGNHNGGGGNNSLINGYILRKSGRYLIIAGGVGSGQYQLIASTETGQFNPTPRITRLAPNPVTATIFGTDMWLGVYGENFMPTSQARWNGNLRPIMYNNPGSIYIRLQRTDTSIFAPTISYITISNPAPGGGTSNRFPLGLVPGVLGESALLEPAGETTVQTGVQTSFAISWTAPITATTWRSMQGMDLRIRNQENEVAAWVRVIEQPGQDSFYRLLTAAENQADADSGVPILEGLPGEPRTLTISDTVTLHLEQSEFFGSGLTAIMTPVLSFGPNAIGTWNVEFLVDRKFEEGDEEDEDLTMVQDTDVLGIIHIVPEGCSTAVSNVEIEGPAIASLGETSTYTASVSPADASAPLSYTWVPTPTLGAGTDTAQYTWDTPGRQTVALFVENCGGFAGGVQEVAVSSSPAPDLSIHKDALPVVLPGDTLTYTLTVTNTGAITATNLVITDVIPVGTTHGEQLSSSAWELPELGPFGATAQVSYTVAVTASPGSVITNHSYGVTASGGHAATGSTPTITKVAQVLRALDNDATQTIFTGANVEQSPMLFEIPAGAVFAPTQIALEQLDNLPHEPPTDHEWQNVAFILSAFQHNRAAPELVLSEYVTLTLQPAAGITTGTSAAQLYRWTGDEWSSTGIQCPESSSENNLICIAEGARMGTYALFAATEEQAAEYVLSVTIVGDGSVETEPDHTHYVAGSTVTLHATPAAGWRFDGWSGTVSSSSNPLAITITADTDITATFALEEEEEEEQEPEEEEEEVETERILIPILQSNSQ